LVLDHDVQSMQRIEDDLVYLYRIESGPTIASGAENENDTVTVHGYTLTALKNEQFPSSEALRESRSLMRHTLSRVLGPKPLASRDLYQSYISFQ
ncbi:MAG: hypothetical protein MI673_07480, partial [Thiotrichales bacterium]|nr:hypothetical protein [Thiotrichales bacterium]